MTASIAIQIELSGGCELIFGNKNLFRIEDIPADTTLAQLILILRDKYVTGRQDQFLDPSGTTIRPGILIMVNDCDSEVMGGMEYVLGSGDVIGFVSTLHGG